jgi:hypothetical protein
MTAPGSARSRGQTCIDLPGASKLVGYAGQPDGSLDEITGAAIPDLSRQRLAGFGALRPATEIHVADRKARRDSAACWVSSRKRSRL